MKFCNLLKHDSFQAFSMPQSHSFKYCWRLPSKESKKREKEKQGEKKKKRKNVEEKT